MNFKRKRSRRMPQCTLCTSYRWFGNNKGRKGFRDEKLSAVAKEQMRHG